MDHPRARVALEERGRGVPAWVLRRTYPVLIPPIRWLFRVALERHEKRTSELPRIEAMRSAAPQAVAAAAQQLGPIEVRADPNIVYYQRLRELTAEDSLAEFS
jgi:hypothetical protein